MLMTSFYQIQMRWYYDGEKMKNGLHKFREVNHKEHRRQMYEQWGNKDYF